MDHEYDPAKLTLEEAVERFAETVEAPVTLDDVCAAVLPLLRAAPADVDDALQQALTDSRLFFEDSESSEIVGRRSFFRGRRFLVVPGEAEVADGVLFPGHRFLPYLRQEVFPERCRLYVEGAPVPLRTVRWSLERCLPVLSFLERLAFLEYLLASDGGNAGVLAGGSDRSAEMTVAVYDLRAVYDRLGFQAGDALELTVRDWHEGLYDVAHVTAAERQRRRRKHGRDWNEIWSAALQLAIERLANGHEPLCVWEQAAQAAFAARGSLPDEPVTSLAELTTLPDCLKLAEVEGLGAPVLCPAGMDAEELEDLATPLFPQSLGRTGRCDSLEAIVKDFGLIGAEGTIDAAIREQLAAGRCDREAALLRINRGNEPIPFFDARQAAICRRLLAERWEVVSRHYDMAADAPFAPLRTQLFDMLARHARALRGLDAVGCTGTGPEAEWVRESAEQQGTMLRLLALAAAPATSDPREWTALVFRVLGDSQATADRFEGRIAELRETMEAETAEAEAVREARVAALGAAKVYRLKLSLLYAEPEVWRQVDVSNDMTLAEFHDVIQILFGWDDEHMHAFRRNGRKAEDREWLENDDESDLQLRELLPAVRSSLTYRYDFGDDWTLRVVVQKTLSAEEADPCPRYVAGDRAAPPEDCGGIPGFLRAVAARRVFEGEFDPACVPEARIRKRLDLYRGARQVAHGPATD